jgi:uncharacterized protein YceK
MKSRVILLILSAVCTSGCGTVLNLVAYDDNTDAMFSHGEQVAPKEIYGGVAIDGASGAEWISQGDTLLGLYVLGVDLPLSVAGDTLTLPLTMASSFGNPLPDTHRTTESLGSFGKNVKETSSGLLHSIPSFGEMRDSMFGAEEPTKTEIVH